MDSQNLWKVVMSELETTLSKANYKMWMNDTFIAEDKDDVITIGVPSHFYLDWIRRNYHKNIAETLRRLRPTISTIDYRVATKDPTPPSELVLQPVPIKELEKPKRQVPSYDLPVSDFQPAVSSIDPVLTTPAGHTPLDPTRSFASFIVGNSNRLAHAVSLAAAAEPGRKYNPLFLYGGVGLGKTHLAQAIGNAIRSQNPMAKIMYVSCETFTNEFVDSIRKNNQDAFKKRFRYVDVLLIDDVQFLSGKEGTQEEFFHTFNALHQSKKQIVLTADREPQNIPELEERLTSRFAWGMVADIQPPDLETRVAILRTKCLERNYKVEDAALLALAELISSNIRELEGALQQLITRSEVDNRAIDGDFVRFVFAGTAAARSRANISINRIIQVVCDYFELRVEEVMGDRRFKELVYPRQLAMYLLRHELSYSYPNIGKALGGKDHTTIMHGVRKIDRELARNNTMQYDLAKLKERLHESP